MDKIIFARFPELRVETYTKSASHQPTGLEVTDFAYSSEKNGPLVIFASDEIPFFFYVPTKNLFGAAKLGKEATLNEFIKKKIHEIIVQFNLDPSAIYCYLGPSLTFSHTIVERPLIEHLMETGYRAAAKRTDGVDFFDMPVMNVVMLRSLGIPFENIYIDNHDTYECDTILYSSLRGDKRKNGSVIELKK
jgi:copper oxidase (laccase) domain-containing protein